MNLLQRLTARHPGLSTVKRFDLESVLGVEFSKFVLLSEVVI